MSSISEGSARSGIQSYETARGRRWRVRYELPAGADGERRQTSKRGFTSKRDAQRFLRNVLADIDRLYDRLEAQGKRRGRCATAGITCREHDCSPSLHDGIAPKTLTNLHGLLHKALVDGVKRERVRRNVAGVVEAPGSERPTHRWW